MKKSIKESKTANTKAGKQVCNRLSGQHPNIEEAPKNKLFSKLEKKQECKESHLVLRPEKLFIFMPTSFELKSSRATVPYIVQHIGKWVEGCVNNAQL